LSSYFLISHDVHRAHGRHLHRADLIQRGLNISELEEDDELQDAVLSVHHSCMLTVGNTGAAKLIENHLGIAHFKVVGQVQIPIQVPVQQQPPQPAAPATPNAKVARFSIPKFSPRLAIALIVLAVVAFAFYELGARR
jgi:hypothetical protein